MHAVIKISCMVNGGLITAIVSIIIFTSSCASGDEKKKQENAGKEDVVATAANQTVNLPAPYATESATKVSNVTGWPEGKTPLVPAGFSVTKFAGDLENPRWIYVANNEDVFVAEFEYRKKCGETGKGRFKWQGQGRKHRW